MEASPFATPFPPMPDIRGVKLYTGHSGMRYDREDLLMVELVEGTTVAGLLTTNQLPGAPVIWCREHLPKGLARGLVVNAGIANVCTGKAGLVSTQRTAEAAANQIGCSVDKILVCSTGVIGERVDDEKLVETLKHKLRPVKWEPAARAIMTTDTFAKGATRTATIGAETVTICGIIKGSGMIAPDMATMLGFIFTDAKIPAHILKTWLQQAATYSYHAITVDSDTSTSDAILCFATGQREHWEVSDADDPAWEDFREKFFDVHHQLAMQVVKDGEGISKLIKVQVRGAVSDISARRMARAIAESPLVKTAIAGEDANWGRIVMAVGKAGEPVNADKVCVWIGQYLIVLDGEPYPDYEEVDVTAYMRGDTIDIAVDVGVGEASAKMYSSDLTHAYIDINADYRS